MVDMNADESVGGKERRRGWADAHRIRKKCHLLSVESGECREG